MKAIKKVVVPLAFWLAVWQVAAWVVGDSVFFCARPVLKEIPLLLPGPWTVICTLAGLVVEWEFWQAAGLTLLRVFLGLVVGVVLGTLIAVLTCASRWCDRLLSPPVKVIRATPVASFILLVFAKPFPGAFVQSARENLGHSIHLTRQLCLHLWTHRIHFL